MTTMQEAQDTFSSAVTEEDFTAAAVLMTKVQTEACLKARRLIKEARDATAAYQLQIEKAKTDIPSYTLQIAAVAKEVLDLGPRSIAIDKETWDGAHTTMTTRQTVFQARLAYAMKLVEDDIASKTILQKALTALQSPAQSPQQSSFFQGNTPNQLPFPFPFLPPPPSVRIMKLPKEQAQFKQGNDVFLFMDRFECTISEANPSSLEEFQNLLKHCVDAGTAKRLERCMNMEEVSTQLLATTIQIAIEDVDEQIFYNLCSEKIKESESVIMFNNRINSRLRRTSKKISKQRYMNLLPQYLQDRINIGAVGLTEEVMMLAEKKGQTGAAPVSEKHHEQKRLRPNQLPVESYQASGPSGKVCQTHPGMQHGDLECFNPNPTHKAWLVAQGHKEECPKCKAASVTNKQITFKHFQQTCRNKNRQTGGPSVRLKFAGLEIGMEYLITPDESDEDEEIGPAAEGQQRTMKGGFNI
ncbi:hypothetical protein BDR26DRAFT_930939 [Obelidium mucronatum]|nr:hypothetical protein BDR26DRAFT_930939 [Obelidium mucronatum]